MQAPVGLALLEGQQLLMDRIHSAVGPANAHAGPYRTAFLQLAAAQCVRRRLRAFQRALDLSLRDASYHKLLALHSSCLIQACGDGIGQPDGRRLQRLLCHAAMLNQGFAASKRAHAT
jgi:hypothetical protein